MNKSEAKRIIKDDLTPRYERARDSVIEYVTGKAVEYRALRMKMNDLERIADGREGKEWRKTYIALYGFYNKIEKRQEIGTFYSDIPKKYAGILASTDAKIKAHYTKEYKDLISNVTEAVYNDIKAFKPVAIEVGISNHDMHFILTSKGGKEQSYTINTIVAGGYIQVIHNRTLRKLHKGVV